MAQGSSNGKFLKGGLLPLVACLFISASLWVLVQTSKWDVYSFYIAYELEGIPKNYRMVGNQPKQALIRQNTTGLNFLYNQLFHKKSFYFDFPKSKIHPYSGSLKYILVHDLLKEHNLFQANGSTVISVEPDTVFLESGKVYAKVVPLKVQIEANFKEGFFPVSNPIPSVKEVTIRGKKDLLKTIDTLVLTAKLPGQLSEGKDFKVEIPEKGSLSTLEMMPSKVKCRINVEKFTEKKVEVKILPINIPKGMKVKLLPDKASLRTSIPLSHYEEVTEEIFQITADFSSPILNNRVRLKIDKIPYYCMNTKLENNFVEFILIK
jgi:hypothetical protein